VLLQQHQSLFSVKLGKYTKRQLHLELKEGAQPVHCKPYPVPKAHEQLFKEEAGYLVSDGVLEPLGATEHAYSTFITPKKDGCVRWVSDFLKLNTMLKRSIYPLPRINDILTKRKDLTELSPTPVPSFANEGTSVQEYSVSMTNK
jgi:hypothetical protein